MQYALIKYTSTWEIWFNHMKIDTIFLFYVIIDFQTIHKIYFSLWFLQVSVKFYSDSDAICNRFSVTLLYVFYMKWGLNLCRSHDICISEYSSICFRS